MMPQYLTKHQIEWVQRQILSNSTNLRSWVEELIKYVFDNKYDVLIYVLGDLVYFDNLDKALLVTDMYKEEYHEDKRIKNKYWSVIDQQFMTLDEIKTKIKIMAQG
jgi:hypothetical protein